MDKATHPPSDARITARRKKFAPGPLAAFKAFSDSVFADGALLTTMKQCAVVVAHVTECPYCIRGHTAGALKKRRDRAGNHGGHLNCGRDACGRCVCPFGAGARHDGGESEFEFGRGAPCPRSLIHCKPKSADWDATRSAMVVRINASPAPMIDAQIEMDNANRDVVLATLNALLEAERAGAKVTSQTAAEISDPDLRRLVASIRQDEARWCVILTKALFGVASYTYPENRRALQQGDGYRRPAATHGLPEPGPGLARSQARGLLPAIHEEQLHNALAAMLASHRDNIRRVEVQLAATQARMSSGEK
ncbi:DUF6306 domain-containing protein [Cupriavidus sp. SK-3]|uniref:DUF6306 domain-containing protein n=1 Tax=Cupriavidus sp. SK-3 TaxID=1470558 RepID=UPI002100AA83|nr:DUF6306 domain-containing protein [Cupriavidus sp. SK-3]